MHDFPLSNTMNVQNISTVVHSFITFLIKTLELARIG